MFKPIAILLTLLCVLPAPGAAQAPTSAPAPQDSASASTATTDVFDLLRRLRHKPDPVEAWDYRKPMKAFSPVDTYGRSARGYSEGQFRGEKLGYGEIEYRGTLTRNGLLGMVAFLNTTTVSNRAGGEQLFDSFATGGGAGLRLLINKRSKTNLCFDIGFGKQGSKGVYLAVQEAF